ncbi:MAG: trigger factor [Clostridiales bacterium]|nr:trigger factor [Clostridiales bacterium]
MSYQSEKISGNQYKISFTVPAEEFDAAMQKAYLKNRGRINVPGFRKGKAPRKLIENMYGEAIFYDDAFDLIFPDLYDEAVEKDDLFPVDQPSVEVDQIGSGQELQFTATVYVKPDITLGDYKGLKGTRHLHPITQEEIDHRMSHDIQKMTVSEDVEGRPLQEGDTANINYLGTLEGVPFEGGQADGHDLKLGSGAFIPGFEEQVVGMNVGDEKTITVTFPEQYHAENLAGKEVQFAVKVNGASHEVAPELDDDFAQDVSEHKTFEEYRAALVKELEERRDKQAESGLENELIQQAVDAADGDIPEAMINRQVDRMFMNMKMQMVYSGMRMEDYLMYTNTTEEELKERFRDDARNNVKTDLVLEAIAKQEGIEATQEDVDAQVEEYAKEINQDVAAYKATLSDNQKEAFKDLAVTRKVVALIKDSADIDVHEGSHDDEPIDVQEVLEQVSGALEEKEETTEEKKPAKKTRKKKDEEPTEG